MRSPRAVVMCFAATLRLHILQEQVLTHTFAQLSPLSRNASAARCRPLNDARMGPESFVKHGLHIVFWTWPAGCVVHQSGGIGHTQPRFQFRRMPAQGELSSGAQLAPEAIEVSEP